MKLFLHEKGSSFMKLSKINGTGENFVFGWLFFKGRRTHHTCLLQENGATLTLTIPFNAEEQDILSWFDRDESSFFGWNLNKDKIPEHFWIQDVFKNRKYSISDYAVRGQKINFGSGNGSIKLELASVVFDTSFHYFEISKIRTSSPEYLYWTGLRSLSMETSYSSVSGLPESFKAEVTNKGKICFRIDNTELALIPSWNTFSVGEDKKAIGVTDNVLFECSIAGKTSYNKLIVFHERFRNLLCILGWRKIGYKEIKVFNKEDTITDLNEEKRPAGFRELITTKQDMWSPIENPDSFLFYFNDIGIKGLRLWLLLWEKYQRALMTFSYVARNNSILAVETQIIELSISIEEIAKPLSLELEKKEPHKHIEKLKLIVESLPADYLELLPSSYESMLQDISNTYNSLKHTKEKRDERKREEWLDHNNLLYCMFACRMILLLWISSRLGCSSKKLNSAVNDDSKLKAVRKWWGERQG